MAEFRVNGDLVPEFHELLYDGGGRLWLPLEPVVSFSEGRFTRDGRQVEVALYDPAEIILIDLEAGSLMAASVSHDLGDSVQLRGDVVFVERVALSAHFGLDVNARLAEGFVDVASERPLPRNLRLMREQLWARLRPGSVAAGEPVRTLDYDYTAFSGVQADITVSALEEIETGRRQNTFSINASSEAAYLTNHLFLAGDEGGLRSARWHAGRTDPRGALLGAEGLYGLSIGDTVGQSIPMVGSLGRGRGARIQAAPVRLTDSFSMTSVEGDAPPGWDAELYVSGQLRNFQRVGPDGRYVFQDIDILYGRNDIKVVLYGPNGAYQTVDYSQSVSPGMLPPGKLYGWATLLQPGTSVLGIEPQPSPSGGGLDYAARADWGVAESLTLSGQIGQHTSAPVVNGLETAPVTDRFGSLEARVRLGGQGGTAGIVRQESTGGSAWYASTFLPFLNTGMSLRAEGASEAFETLYTGTGGSAMKRRIQVSTSIPMAIGPGGSVAAYAERVDQKNGGQTDSFSAFYGHELLNAPVTHELTLSRSRPSGGSWSDLSGTYRAVTSYDRDQLQLRAEYIAALERKLESRLLNFQALWRHNDRDHYSAGVSYAFDGNHGYYASFSRDFGGRFVGSMTAARTGDVTQISARISMSLGAHPGHGVHVTSQERAAYGALRVNAFYDDDYSGRREAGEEGIAALEVRRNGNDLEERTDQTGRLTAWALDPGSPYRIEVGKEKLLTDFLATSVRDVIVWPRPGRIFVLDVPVVEAVSVSGRICYEDGDGQIRPLGRTKVEALDKDGTVIAQTMSLSDGYYSFDSLFPGNWTIRTTSDRLAPGGKPVVVSAPLFIAKKEIDIPDQNLVYAFSLWGNGR